MADYKTIFSEPTNKWFQKTFKEPTEVQKNAWPAIADGNHTLVSAPTGTGKTLSAFLYFIDRLKLKSREGQLKEELYLIYVSPLKSLAGDIRENLNRPLREYRPKRSSLRLQWRSEPVIPRDGTGRG